MTEDYPDVNKKKVQDNYGASALRARRGNAGQSNAERIKARERRQKIFLLAYSEHGTVRAACRAAEVGRAAYDRWVRDPDCQRKVEKVKYDFAELLEEIALDRVKNPDKNRGSDLLLIGLLNANMPQKYRPQVHMSEDSAKDLIIEWRKAAKEVSSKGVEKEKEDSSELSAGVEDTLNEILTRRGKGASEKREEQKDNQR